MKKSKNNIINILVFVMITFLGVANYTIAAKNNPTNIKAKRVHTQSRIYGTIASISGNTVSIDTKENKSTVRKTVTINSQTKFFKRNNESQKDQSKKEQNISNFKVGDNVNVNIKLNKDGTTSARIIRFAPPKHKKVS